MERRPPQVNQLLAKDRDQRVRILLARKLAALVPGLSPVQQARLHQETWDALNALVADEALRVRAIIADAVKELPNAPRELIRQLAQDPDLSVYEPVIRLSPLLTTEDLVALVTRPPAAGTVSGGRAAGAVGAGGIGRNRKHRQFRGNSRAARQSDGADP